MLMKNGKKEAFVLLSNVMLRYLSLLLAIAAVSVLLQHEENELKAARCIVEPVDTVMEQLPEAHPHGERRVVLITLDKLLLADLTAYSGPLLRSLLEKSAVSLMNTNTAGRPNTEGGYLTLGAGARLQGNWTARLAFNREENWQDTTGEALYQLHSATAAPIPGEVIHPYWGKINELNKNLPYPAHPGIIGETLQLHGLATAVIGNSDNNEPGRQVVSIAMDGAGRVTYGDVAKNILQEDENAPYGFCSDYSSYLKALTDVWEKSSFIVIDWGDSSRIDAYRDHLPEGRREALLHATLAEFDNLLAGLLPYLDHNTLLIILAPSPPLHVSGNEQLMTPLLMYAADLGQGGLLQSGTTRRPGIVANIDLAPTVLEHLELNAPHFLWGAPLEFVPAGGHLESLSALSAQTARIYKQRPPVLRGYILSLIIFSGLVVFAVISRHSIFNSLCYIICILLNIPAVLLLAPAFSAFPAAELSHSVLLLIMIAIPVILPALLLLRLNPPASFSYSGLVVSLLLLFDLWCGAPLNSRSILGYDPVSGARFYGLGNEYMGVLIGSAILGFLSLFSLLQHSFKKYSSPLCIINCSLFAVFAMLLIFTMASPAYGANFGGAVTAGIALSIALGSLICITGKQVIFSKSRCLPALKTGHNKGKGTWSGKPRFLVAGLIALFIVMTALFIYYLNVPGSSEYVSHLGRTIELVRSDGLAELKNVAMRKIEMNLKLIRFSLWSRVLLGFIALLTVLYYYPMGLMCSIFKRDPFFKAVLGGSIAGSVVSFCFNDSGVVAAATLMLYGGLPLFILALREVTSFNSR